MGYRNPAYLAKVAATVDVVSEGRLEMGIGAGWYEHEWRAYGYDFPRAGERLQMLREGVEIMRESWTTGRSTYAGKHYTIDGALCFPRPLQGDAVPGSPQNGIPAVGGRRRRAQDAADRGRVRRLHELLGGARGVQRARASILRGHCEDIGRDFEEIVRSAELQRRHRARPRPRCASAWTGSVTTTRGTACRPTRSTSTVHMFETGPLVGTPEQILETLVDYEARGMTYAITNFVEQAFDLSGVELFEREVVPALVEPRAAQQPLALHPRRRLTPCPPRPGACSPSPTPPPRCSSSSPGVPKVRDPGDLVRAVRSVGMPLGRGAVRAFALAEVVVGASRRCSPRDP